jgi:glycine dehydrogenase subunit 2
MHFNTHKTFSTPHGCGGPGAGPIAVRSFLSPYLPVPQVRQRQAGSPGPMYYLDWDRPKSIGKVRSFFGQFAVLLRCWSYIAACGPRGLRNVAETAVLNANYLAARLRHRYDTPYFDPAARRFCAHEFITVPKPLLAGDVSLTDIAKRLIDFGVHPPTMHWPVHDCLMIEPTESESLATLDRFVEVMLTIADEALTQPDLLKHAPHSPSLGRLDEVAAARNPILAAPEQPTVCVKPTSPEPRSHRQVPPFESATHPGPSRTDPIFSAGKTGDAPPFAGPGRSSR